MIRALLAIVLGWLAFRLRRPAVDLVVPVRVQEFRPGGWFEVYLSEWMEYFDIDDRDHVTSGIVKGADSGDFIWCTVTPEWDRDWFNAHGRSFPRKWVHFSVLVDVVGEPDTPVTLPGL